MARDELVTCSELTNRPTPGHHRQTLGISRLRGAAQETGLADCLQAGTYFKFDLPFTVPTEGHSTGRMACARHHCQVVAE